MHRKKQTAASSWSLFPDEAFATPEPAETAQVSNKPESNRLADHNNTPKPRPNSHPVTSKSHDHDDRRADTPNTYDHDDKYTDTPKVYDHSELFRKLSQSAFRSRFHLSEKDKTYAREKGRDTLRRHAADFIAKRLAPALLPNDGKQTPMRGHPVFRAQHATGCCCRGCFYKWHHIPPGRALTAAEQEYAVSVLMTWIDQEMKGPEKQGDFLPPTKVPPVTADQQRKEIHKKDP